MTHADRTLDQFLNILAAVEPDRPLIFQTTENEIGTGYHVTEFKHLTVSSIDCGGRRAAWQEAQLQLLDGGHGTYMSVGKFVAIGDRSVAAVDGLGAVPLSVEYAPQNRGLHRYHIGDPIVADNAVRVPLVDDKAACKPEMDMACCPLPLTKRAALQDRPKSDCCSPR